MKSSIAAIVLAFASIAAAQPYHRHHRHQQFHELEKRNEEVVVEEVIVGVEAGPGGKAVTTFTVLSTSTIGPPPPATTTTTAPVVAAELPTTTPSPSPDTSSAPPAKVADYVAPSSSAPAAPAETSAAPAAPSTPSSGGLFGVTYGPYDDAGVPKSQDQINADVAKLTGYGVVRVYDANDRTAMVIKAAKANGLKVFAGVNNDALASGKLSDALNFIIEGAKASGFDSLYAVGIGNEWVFGGKSASELMGYVKSAKETLAAAGYTGPVVAPDTTAAYTANPELCDGDFASINAHAFFEGGGCPVERAAKSIKSQYDSVVSTCHGKDVYISETGWPSASGPGSPSIGSPENQKKAVDDIKALFPQGNVCFISAYDEPWKLKYSPDPMGIEAHWGMLGA